MIADRPGGSGALDRARATDRNGMRDANLALLAQVAFGAPQPLSRADLAEHTAVSRATVTRMVDDLVRVGLLIEGEASAGSGPGRPAIPLHPSGARYAALGLQVNVSRLTVRAIDLAGAVLGEESCDGEFANSDPDAVLPQLVPLIERARGTLGARRLAGAGLALPGLVESGSGTLLRAPNLGWADVRAGDVLASALDGLPLSVDNEAKLAALASARAAPGRAGGIDTFLYLSGEVGIGGAAIVGGRPMRGRHGWAGEFGHVCVDPAGAACACGSTGCLETVVGRTALLARAGMPSAASPAVLAAAVATGDARAVAALETAADALAIALGGIVNILDIPVVVLGGHLAALGAGLAGAVEDRLRSRVLHTHWAAPEVRVGPPDPAAAATGAAYVPLERLITDPATLVRRPR